MGAEAFRILPDTRYLTFRLVWHLPSTKLCNGIYVLYIQFWPLHGFVFPR
jgi:hypothetical protein